jgi:hypothetical protein
MVDPTEISNLQERRKNRRPNKAQVYFSKRQNELFEAYIAETEQDKSYFIREIVMREVKGYYANKEKEAAKLEALRQMGGSSR